MGKAGGYILKPAPKRKEILLAALTSDEYEEPRASEPVSKFQHSKNSPLVVFACLEDSAITHILDGKRTISAGTGLSKLNLGNPYRLEKPLKLTALVNALPNRLQTHFKNSLKGNSYLSPKTFEALVEIVAQQAPDLKARLARFSRERSRSIASLSLKQKQELALQKESLAVSMRIAGLNPQELLEWTPATTPPRSFLDGLSSVEVREDAMILTDLDTIPGFLLDTKTHAATRSFVDAITKTIRLTVVMANRLPLEEQTGSDLIYCNDTYKSFVFVQYKAMEREGDDDIYRWQNKPNDDLIKEINRMNNLFVAINQVHDDGSKESFRLHNNPFMLKFCRRTNFNPDDAGLFPGMYIPLEYWERFSTDKASTGKRGGKYLSYRNIGRKLTNTEFIILVAGSWIGTTIPQFASLQALVRNVLEAGRTLTFAIERNSSPAGDKAQNVELEDEEEDEPVVVKERN